MHLKSLVISLIVLAASEGVLYIFQLPAKSGIRFFFSEFSDLDAVDCVDEVVIFLISYFPDKWRADKKPTFQKAIFSSYPVNLLLYQKSTCCNSE